MESLIPGSHIAPTLARALPSHTGIPVGMQTSTCDKTHAHDRLVSHLNPAHLSTMTRLPPRPCTYFEHNCPLLPRLCCFQCNEVHPTPTVPVPIRVQTLISSCLDCPFELNCSIMSAHLPPQLHPFEHDCFEFGCNHLSSIQAQGAWVTKNIHQGSPTPDDSPDAAQCPMHVCVDPGSGTSNDRNVSPACESESEANVEEVWRGQSDQAQMDSRGRRR
jgi:hypothetical protein